MRCLFVWLAPLSCLVTGCYTYTEVPGALGKVVDAHTGSPVPHARISRPLGSHEVPDTIRASTDGRSVVSVTSGKSGRFDLPPALHTQIAFMYLRNPKTMSGAFVITADGYATKEVQGVASSRHFWRADLGDVELSRP